MSIGFGERASRLWQALQFPWPMRQEPARGIELTAYRKAILTLLSEQGSVRVVVVGANDGMINDPLYETAMEKRRAIGVVLIEPQQSVIPFLRSNYREHPSAHFICSAVGAPGEMVLHSLKPEHWHEVSAPYAEGWPSYRAPTGVTSTDRASVLEWARSFAPSVSAEEGVAATTVSCRPLAELLPGHNVPWKHFDVLQVDAEGQDDVVIYHSSIDQFEPRIIHFEHKMLDDLRRARLTEYLSVRQYALTRNGNNTLAIRRAADPGKRVGGGRGPSLSNKL